MVEGLGRWISAPVFTGAGSTREKRREWVSAGMPLRVKGCYGGVEGVGGFPLPQVREW